MRPIVVLNLDGSRTLIGPGFYIQNIDGHARLRMASHTEVLDESFDDIANLLDARHSARAEEALRNQPKATDVPFGGTIISKAWGRALDMIGSTLGISRFPSATNSGGFEDDDNYRRRLEDAAARRHPSHRLEPPF